MGTFLGVLFVVVCLLLVIVVLLQKGRGGGLGAAFGGAASSAFGTKTGDVFTWITIILTGLFLLLAMGTTWLLRPEPGNVSAIELSPPATETEIDGPTPIVMSCRTPGAKVVYTVDGTEPMRDMYGQTGKATATVRPGVTLRARAFKGKWTPSEPVEVTYTQRAPYVPPPAQPTTQPATQPTGEPADEPADVADEG